MLWLPALAWAGGIFVLSSLTVPTRPPLFPQEDKAAHLALFGALAWWLFQPLARTHGLAFAKAALLACLLTSIYGMLDELHQLFTPGRMCDIRDWAADSVGGLTVWLTARWPRRRT